MDSGERERGGRERGRARRERCQYGGVMVARYEGSVSGQGRSVTPLHRYLGQGKRRGREGEKKDEVLQLLKRRFARGGGC